MADLKHLMPESEDNYRRLRRLIGLTALLFPPVVVVVGLCWLRNIQPTLSDYYYASEPVGMRADQFPVRLWFCGLLFIAGFFFVRYRGFSKWEDRFLSATGVFTFGVAIFPMSRNGINDWPLISVLGFQLSLHGISAVLAFLSVIIVIVFFSEETLEMMESKNKTLFTRLKWGYRAIALVMTAGIAIAVALHYISGTKWYWILIAETIGVWGFAAYWLLKNFELDESDEERRRFRKAAEMQVQKYIADDVEAQVQVQKQKDVGVKPM